MYIPGEDSRIYTMFHIPLKKKLRPLFTLLILICIGIFIQHSRTNEARYSFETSSTSYVQGLSKGVLRELTHKDTGLTLVVATEDNLQVNMEDQWTYKDIAKDTMWVPGSCASKPSLFIQDRYIFIDDGKVKETDNMSTYVIYDIQDKTYTYFGGNRGISVGDIVKIETKNGSLIFHILTPGNIIQRTIDPETLTYEDTIYTYKVPSEISRYKLTTGTEDSTYMLQDEVTNTLYSSTQSEGAYVFTKHTYDSLDDLLTPDSDLEKDLDPVLRKTIPAYVKEAPYETHNKTIFKVNELLSSNTHLLLLIQQRFGIGYETPAVYTLDTKEMSPVTITPLYIKPVNYVPLGAYIHD